MPRYIRHWQWTDVINSNSWTNSGATTSYTTNYVINPIFYLTPGYLFQPRPPLPPIVPILLEEAKKWRRKGTPDPLDITAVMTSFWARFLTQTDESVEEEKSVLDQLIHATSHPGLSGLIHAATLKFLASRTSQPRLAYVYAEQISKILSVEYQLANKYRNFYYRDLLYNAYCDVENTKTRLQRRY